MKLLMIMLVAVSLAASLTGAAYAHLPEGFTYFAFQFPDHLVPKLDGDLSDWAFIPEAYLYNNTEHLIESYVQADRTPGAVYDASDLDIKTILGWNESSNRLIFATWIFDDVHQEDRPANAPGLMHTDDVVEIMVDADHSGGMFRGLGETEEEKKRLESSQAQRYGIAFPAPDERGFRFSNLNAPWMEQNGGPNVAYGWQYKGVLGGEGTVYYEISLKGWDDMNYQGPEVSKEHDLREGEIIGFNPSYGEFDADDNYEAYWTFSGGSGTTSNASVLADFLLNPIEPGLPSTPTAVEATTWARIKSTFMK